MCQIIEWGAMIGLRLEGFTASSLAQGTDKRVESQLILIIIRPNYRVNTSLWTVKDSQKSIKYLKQLSPSRAKTIEERLHSVKNNSNFEIATLFHHLYGEGKRAAISKLELSLTEWSRSYIIVLALIRHWNCEFYDHFWVDDIVFIGIYRKLEIDDSLKE